MTTPELIQYYVQLLILQYYTKPKAQATIQALVTAEVANQIIAQVEQGFSIQTAVGVQLDTLAKYVGAQRTIYGLDIAKSYFQFRYAADPPPPTEVQNGFAPIAAPNTPWYWIRPNDINSPVQVLTDGQLMQLIEYLAAVESLSFVDEAIDNFFFQFFGQYVTWVDGMNMTMTVTHSASTDPNTLFQVAAYLNALPKPAGVALTVVET